MRICICAAQVPFSSGGAELQVATLRAQLKQRGFEVEVVSLPFSWEPHLQVLKSAFAWRLVDLQANGAPIDLVVATKFPSYLVRHPNKIVWLTHQFRQAYDLLGTSFSDYAESPEDQTIVRMVREMDTRALTECRSLFAIARNPAERLRRFNGLEATPLYPPAPLDGRYRSGEAGDYVFTASRLDRMKRVDLLVRAIASTKTAVRALIAGEGPERAALEALADQLGLRGRVEFLGRVDDERLLELYAGSLAVFYAPYDEDYGYVTVEAFKSAKSVLTANDSGGVLEFVVEGRSGFVCPARDPSAFSARLDTLFRDRALAARLGQAGCHQVEGITWERVIHALTGRTDAGSVA